MQHQRSPQRQLGPLVLVLLAACGSPAEESSDPRTTGSDNSHPPLTAAEVKRIAPKAAAFTATDWKIMCEATEVRPNMFASQTLSPLVIMIDGKPTTEPRDIEFVDNGRPADIVSAMRPMSPLGIPLWPYVSILHRHHIDNVVVRQDGERAATGTIAFRSKAYAGKTEFWASFENGAWRMDGFRLPGLGKETVRQDDGTWKIRRSPR